MTKQSSALFYVITEAAARSPGLCLMYSHSVCVGDCNIGGGVCPCLSFICSCSCVVKLDCGGSTCTGNLLKIKNEPSYRRRGEWERALRVSGGGASREWCLPVTCGAVVVTVMVIWRLSGFSFSLFYIKLWWYFFSPFCWKKDSLMYWYWNWIVF